MGWTGLLAPVLAAAFPILFLYAHNVREVTLASVLPVLLGAVVASALLALLLWRVFGNPAQAGLVGTVWVLVFLLYGRFYNTVEGLDLWDIGLGSHRILLPLAVATVTLPLLPVFLRRKVGLGFMPYVTAVLAVIVVFNLATVALTEARRPGQGLTPTGLMASSAGHISDTSRLPDIYYIVPDRYASSSTWEEHFGYDNSEFMGFLEDSGFYIADKSFANYHATYLSLASSLNMDYLDRIRLEVGEPTGDHTPAYAMIEDNEVWRTLKEQYGYSFIHFGSWWGPTEDNPNADVRINKYPRLLGLIELKNEFHRMLLRTTVLGAFQDSLLQQDYFEQGEADFERCRAIKADRHPPNDVAEDQCHRALYTLQQLRDMPNIEGPKFVFVHLLLPHPPFVFGPDGEVVEEPPPFYYWDQVSADEIEVLKRSKLDQLTFTNKKLTESIEHILAESPQPPVIILQADEGPWTREYLHEPAVNWPAETFHIRQRIINAYYLPGLDAGAVLYPSISPVNTFRVIFNEYFNADLPLLDDRAYISVSPDNIYTFDDITDRVKYEE